MQAIKPLKPSPQEDIKKFISMLEGKNPFVYIRFSDGEMEIIRNQFLEIASETIVFRGSHGTHQYPLFDRKTFNPEIDQAFRFDLLGAAMHREAQYYKGIPASHNGAVLDRNLMLRLNGGISPSITFSDLFLNGNFLFYRKHLVPLFRRFENVAVIGNFRMQPGLFMSNWQHISIPDNFFEFYSDVKKNVLSLALRLPLGSLVLSSASSLSNVIGFELIKFRNDITFIDIGTSLHDLMGMKSGIRGYHIELEKWRLHNFFKKASYKLSREYRLRW